ncbi:MAG: heavy-metal-associated domain-containing protein [Novosphingobium sp.]|nr:heavy-metal-associated domain-containing protein [Novosphingobium sp.]
MLAQIEGDRGIPPVANTSDIEVHGIDVDSTGKTAQEARVNGWRQAYEKAWEQLKGPALSPQQIEAMVSAVVVEHEELGPHRYIARLGVIFDRTRAGQFVGGTEGTGARSQPLLVIPVLYSGGTAQVFEVRGPWQRAWAEFHPGASAIDYVRPSGAGGESLLVTAGQPGRRSRIWWRTILDQFDASDVIVPIARLDHEWPGGPVRGTFTARFGPDDTFIESFTLTAKDDAGVPAMLNQAVQRFDAIYTTALDQGVLAPDPSLNPPAPQLDPTVAALIAAGRQAEETPAGAVTQPGSTASPSPTASTTESASPSPSPTAEKSGTYTVQFASPDARAVDEALGMVRGIAGVQGAATTSLAIGGTSVMRVTFSGDLEALAAALRARGARVTVGRNALSIRP